MGIGSASALSEPVRWNRTHLWERRDRPSRTPARAAAATAGRRRRPPSTEPGAAGRCRPSRGYNPIPAMTTPDSESSAGPAVPDPARSAPLLETQELLRLARDGDPRAQEQL